MVDNFSHFLDQSANSFGDEPAIIEQSGTISFKELNVASKSVAQLLNKHSIGEKTMIGLVFPNGQAFVSSLFGAASTGATILPIYHNLTYIERTEVYQKANVAYVLSSEKHVRNEIKDFEVIDCVENILLIKLPNLNHEFLAGHVNHPAIVRFSSGTTGASKGVILSHQSVIERSDAVAEIMQLKEGTKVLWVLPMAYHFVATVITFIKHGITMIVCPSFFAEDILKMANTFRADFLYSSPLHIRMLANDKSGQKFESLSIVISTSSGISSADCELFQSRFGIPVTQAYGIIEVGLPLMNFNSNFPNRVGKPGLDYQVAILDHNFNELGIEKEGKLAVKGKGMFNAYMVPKKNRNNSLKNGWFITGDLAMKYSDNSIEILGREKSMINIAGNKVFPEEVEAALEKINGIEAAHVFGVNHPLVGEMVEANVVLSDRIVLTEKEIIIDLHQFLTSFKIPKKINIVEVIDLTSTGKKKRTSND